MNGKAYFSRLLFLVVVIFASGCTTTTRESSPTFTAAPESLRPLKIGLIADTQLTSANTGSSWFYVGEREDSAVNVSIRPPAQNAGSVLLLRGLLSSLASKRPDLILYLGDGANHGCKDELENPGGIDPFTGSGILGELRAFREQHQIPTFFLIGNHDYLGAGNTPKPSRRVKMCGGAEGAPPVYKDQLIAMVHSFNSGNGPYLAKDWEYKDSYIEGTTESYCNDGSRSARDENKGCYLAGVLYAGETEVLLLDTSDYGGARSRYSLLGLQYRGEGGRVSHFSDGDSGPVSQARWFASEQTERKQVPAWRILASHYPLTEQKTPLTGFSRKRGRPALFMKNPLPRHGQCVYSAHNHDSEPSASPLSFRTPRWFGLLKDSYEYYGHETNVGSATDWRPHAIIVECTNTLEEMDEKWKIIHFPENCDKVLSSVSETELHWLTNISFDAEGVYTQHYRDMNTLERRRQWDAVDDWAVRVARTGAYAKSEVLSCVALAASQREKALEEH